MINQKNKKTYDEIAEEVNQIFLGNAPGKPGGPSPGLLMLAPALGAVKQGQLVGPKKLQEWFNMFTRTPFEKRDAPVASGGWKLGGGIEGNVYQIPGTDTTMKVPHPGNDSLIEALRVHAMKDTPDSGMKRFVGTLSKPERDLRSPGPYSEMMDHITAKKVLPAQIEQNPILFTKKAPGESTSVFDPGTKTVNIDSLRSRLNELNKQGVRIDDLHGGNFMLDKDGKVVITDAGIGLDKFMDFVRGGGRASTWNRERPHNVESMMHELSNSLLPYNPTTATPQAKYNDWMKQNIARKLSGSDDPKVIDRWLQNFRSGKGAVDAEFYTDDPKAGVVNMLRQWFNQK